MNSIAHHGLDIKSLQTLVILLTECSVTRTSEILGQPQPTISLCLKRLREAFDDPLLVRHGNHLVPTARGRDLAPSIGKILEDLNQAITPQQPFDPLHGNHHFKLLLANCFGATFLPRIICRLREQAPDAIVDVLPMPAFEQIMPLVADGTADIALGNWPYPPGQLHQSPLFSSDIVCLARKGHPLTTDNRLTHEQYANANHISLTPSTNGPMSPIDGRLAELGLSRRIVASVPDYTSVAHLLTETDFIFSTSRQFAAELTNHMPLAVIDLPDDFGSMFFYSLWHERNHRSPSHRWLRSVIQKVAREG